MPRARCADRGIHQPPPVVMTSVRNRSFSEMGLGLSEQRMGLEQKFGGSNSFLRGPGRAGAVGDTSRGTGMPHDPFVDRAFRHASAPGRPGASRRVVNSSLTARRAGQAISFAIPRREGDVQNGPKSLAVSIRSGDQSLRRPTETNSSDRADRSCWNRK